MDVQALFETRYADEPFVDVMPAGSHPQTSSVRGSNYCRIAVHRPNGGTKVVVLVVEDNLTKGASGQAIQCMNIACGLPEKDRIGCASAVALMSEVKSIVVSYRPRLVYLAVFGLCALVLLALFSGKFWGDRSFSQEMQEKRRLETLFRDLSNTVAEQQEELGRLRLVVEGR